MTTTTQSLDQPPERSLRRPMRYEPHLQWNLTGMSTFITVGNSEEVGPATAHGQRISWHTYSCALQDVIRCRKDMVDYVLGRQLEELEDLRHSHRFEIGQTATPVGE